MFMILQLHPAISFECGIQRIDELEMCVLKIMLQSSNCFNSDVGMML